MFGRSVEIPFFFGARVRLDASWLLLGFGLTWLFATNVFPPALPNLDPQTYWLLGLLLVAGLLVSLLFHELGHLATARHFGFGAGGTTLLLFGGVPDVTDEPPSPAADLLTAAAGPASSFWLAGALSVVWLYGQLEGWAAPGLLLLGQLATLNGLVGAVNLLPAYPLDGARMVRGLLWAVQGDSRWAWQISTGLSSGLGVALIVFGLAALVNGSVSTGATCLAIGFFTRLAARSGHQTALLRRALRHQPVRRFMRVNPVVVPRAISVQEFVDQFASRHAFSLFPVVDGEKLMGVVSLDRLRGLAPEEWDRQSVGAITERVSPANSVQPDAPAAEAFSLMAKGRTNRVLVVETDQLIGVLNLQDLLEAGSSQPA
ncbi:MAG TPA: CBS domain-containing protein [Thermoanaerobaculia bacterium]|nr:CBS domain-containing protein [Thermoanaerobaculia bacterium]